jgi:hypothetical protein
LVALLLYSGRRLSPGTGLVYNGDGR